MHKFSEILKVLFVVAVSERDGHAEIYLFTIFEAVFDHEDNFVPILLSMCRYGKEGICGLKPFSLWTLLHHWFAMQSFLANTTPT